MQMCAAWMISAARIGKISSCSGSHILLPKNLIQSIRSVFSRLRVPGCGSFTAEKDRYWRSKFRKCTVRKTTPCLRAANGPCCWNCSPRRGGRFKSPVICPDSGRVRGKMSAKKCAAVTPNTSGRMIRPTPLPPPEQNREIRRLRLTGRAHDDPSAENITFLPEKVEFFKKKCYIME